MITTTHFTGDFIFPGVFFIGIALLLVSLGLLIWLGRVWIVAIGVVLFVASTWIGLGHMIDTRDGLVDQLQSIGYSKIELTYGREFYAVKDGDLNHFIFIPEGNNNQYDPKQIAP